LSFQFSVAYDDPFHLAQDADLQTLARAALTDWGQYIGGQGTIEVLINVADLSNGNLFGTHAGTFLNRPGFSGGCLL
jgi:hypothetical protein